MGMSAQHTLNNTISGYETINDISSTLNNYLLQTNSI